MKQVSIYSIEELKEQFPDGYDYAYEKYQQEIGDDTLPWQDEIMGSLKATFKYAGVDLEDWSIGLDSSNYVKFTIPTFWSEVFEYDELVDNLEGRKAYKWLKETFDLKSYKRANYKNHFGKPAHRYDFQKLDGADWSCEFTGYCADHDYLESLFDCIYDKMNLEDAFRNLADVAGKMFQNEHEYMMSKEYFEEEASCNDYTYLESGKRI